MILLNLKLGNITDYSSLYKVDLIYKASKNDLLKHEIVCIDKQIMQLRELKAIK